MYICYLQDSQKKNASLLLANLGIFCVAYTINMCICHFQDLKKSSCQAFTLLHRGVDNGGHQLRHDSYEWTHEKKESPNLRPSPSRPRPDRRSNRRCVHGHVQHPRLTLCLVPGFHRICSPSYKNKKSIAPGTSCHHTDSPDLHAHPRTVYTRKAIYATGRKCNGYLVRM